VFVLVGLGFELRLHAQVLYVFSHTASPFCFCYFGDGVSRTIFPSWSQTLILLISASQVAKIKGMSHQHLFFFFFLTPFPDVLEIEPRAWHLGHIPDL
jgi:hypothetical protein